MKEYSDEFLKILENLYQKRQAMTPHERKRPGDWLWEMAKANADNFQKNNTLKPKIK